MWTGGRPLCEAELEANRNFDRILDELNEKYNVKAYDRVSVINAFPELQKAMEKCRAATTFYHLTKEYERDEDE